MENKKYLAELYPFAVPRDSQGKPIENLLWDELLPKGWYILFYQMCEEIKEEPVSKDFYFLDIKEKYGEMRCSAVNSIYSIDKIIEKYETLSKYYCINCGRRKEPTSTYLCEKCKGDKKNGF